MGSPYVGYMGFRYGVGGGTGGSGILTESDLLQCPQWGQQHGGCIGDSTVFWGRAASTILASCALASSDALLIIQMLPCPSNHPRVYAGHMVIICGFNFNLGLVWHPCTRTCTGWRAVYGRHPCPLVS